MCLWDFDTLAMERAGFFEPLELITGKFLRRSPELYRWRIEDRLRKLQASPNDLAALDDLAVAYDKTGQYDLAIATMQAKEARRPGLYETEANLGTFLIHAGRLEEALDHIGRALRINPNAHFGREKYQALLVEHVLEQRRGDTGEQSFAAFLARKHGGSLPEAERSNATIAVLGMMRFSKHDSPPLLTALASLVHDRSLAARALLKASYGTDEAEARAVYRDRARAALAAPDGALEELEQAFRRDLAEAEAWYAEVRKNELTWIREGKDADREFSRRYYARPSAFRRWLAGWAFLDLLQLTAYLLFVALLAFGWPFGCGGRQGAAP
jgi:tetratricopeptide (TPR) repeat protein